MGNIYLFILVVSSFHSLISPIFLFCTFDLPLSCHSSLLILVVVVVVVLVVVVVVWVVVVVVVVVVVFRHIHAEDRVQSQALKFLADKLISIEGFLRKLRYTPFQRNSTYISDLHFTNSLTVQSTASSDNTHLHLRVHQLSRFSSVIVATMP